jgi:hypothetical protein
VHSSKIISYQDGVGNDDERHEELNPIVVYKSTTSVPKLTNGGVPVSGVAFLPIGRTPFVVIISTLNGDGDHVVEKRNPR